MALPIHLDRQLQHVAVEVEHIGAEGMLSAEVEATDLPRTSGKLIVRRYIHDFCRVAKGASIV
jgi:hypothetical protein